MGWAGFHGTNELYIINNISRKYIYVRSEHIIYEITILMLIYRIYTKPMLAIYETCCWQITSCKAQNCHAIGHILLNS